MVLALIVRTGEALNEGDIDQYCIENIARYKRPRRILFVDSIPKNASGKILKVKLRKEH